MTASVLLFDGYVPGDSALENSHWMAERTSELLAATLGHPDAVRASLESLLSAGALYGLVMFGHGDPGHLHMEIRKQHEGRTILRTLDEGSEAGAVYGSDGEPVLDLDNIHLLRGLWCHALACNVGLSLADRAVNAGASCFVAYETSLTPEYETATLPPPLGACLAALVTTTTRSLHAGVRDEALLKERIQEAIDKLEEWLDGNDGAAWIQGQEGFMQVAGLRGLARQLKRDMVVRVAEPDADQS